MLSLVVGYGSGYISWTIIRNNRLDIKLPFLRYPNKWYYILTGEVTKFPENSNKDIFQEFNIEDEISVYIQALVSSQNMDFLYCGIIESFGLSNSKSGIENIVLSRPLRIDFNSEGQIISNHYIKDHIFVLPFSEIKNFRFQYGKNLVDYELMNPRFIKKERRVISHLIAIFLLILLLSMLYFIRSWNGYSWGLGALILLMIYFFLRLQIISKRKFNSTK